LSAAARSLGVSQPALSKMLQELESDTGTPLFARHPRGLTPTPAGERMVLAAVRILTDIAALESDLERIIGRARKGVALGALTSASGGVLASVTSEFHARHPDASVRLIQGRTEGLLPALASGDLDFIVGRIYTPAASDNLVREIFYDEPLAAFMHANHPLAKTSRKSIDPTELTEYDLVLPSTAQRLGVEVESILSARGVPTSKAIRTSAPSVMREMLYTGDYVCVASRIEFAGDLQRGLVRGISLESCPPRPGGIIHRGRHTLGPEVRVYIRILREQVAHMETMMGT
jgi:LysR family pca operon transcriptional activator